MTDDTPPQLQFQLWKYDLRGDVLNLIASIAEGQSDLIDANRLPLWDHPEWIRGWTQDGKVYEPPPSRMFPYASDIWRPHVAVFSVES